MHLLGSFTINLDHQKHLLRTQAYVLPKIRNNASFFSFEILHFPYKHYARVSTLRGVELVKLQGNIFPLTPKPSFPFSQTDITAKPQYNEGGFNELSAITNYMT